MKIHKKYDLDEYRIDAQRCMRCGFCVVLCPIYDFSTWESESPRGRMQMINGILDNELKINDTIKDRMFECTLCAYCKDICPAGVRTVDAFKAIRRRLNREKLTPEALNILEGALLESYNIFKHPAEARTDWIEYMELEDKVKVSSKADIVYFTGCSTILTGRAMSIAASTASILNSLSYNWTILGPNEWCCGNPLLAGGKIDDLEKFAKHNVEAISDLGAKTVVTSCPGCFKTFLEDYPDIIGSLDFEVIHITQLVEKAIDAGKMKFQKSLDYTVTYHDPCELGRYLGIYEPPRKILEKIPGIKFKELLHNRNLTQCCGAGGLMKATFLDLSLDQAKRKIREAKDVGAQIITSACQTCKLNILDAISETESDLAVLDIAEIVAKALDVYPVEI